MIRHRWEHHGVSGLGGLGSFDCSCWRASFQGNHQYHAHRRRAFFVEAKVAVGEKQKPAKPPQPSSTGRAGCNARFLLTRCTFPVLYPVLAPERGPDGKPTPNAESWESRSALATRRRGNPADSSRGRRISDAIERLIEEMAPDREYDKGGHSALLTRSPAWFTLVSCREQHERLSVGCGITP